MIEKLFVAKSGTESWQWLPLWMHLEDTVGVMDYLLQHYVSASLCDACELSPTELHSAAKFLAYTHDIGKATVAFQCKIAHNVGTRVHYLEQSGLKMPDMLPKPDYTPHAIAGEEILLHFGCDASLACIIGAHHGKPTEKVDIRKQKLCKPKRDIVGYENYFGTDNRNRGILEAAWQKIIDKALQKAHCTSVANLPQVTMQAQMLLSGLLIMADWIASDARYFPLLDTDTDEPEVFPYPQRVDNAWEAIRFTDMWDSQTQGCSDTEFENTFGFQPNEIQHTVLEYAAKASQPGLWILEAPMGCGKTEVALSTAKLLAARLHKNGLFFGLPTQATANGIFPRIQHWAEKESEEIYHSIQLKHGSAAFNDAFQNVQRGIPDEDSGSGIVVHSWFNDSKKSCLADFVVATVDQMLMMALKRRHVMLLHLGLAEKIVIIDEVHAYDAYMNQYLERALQWLGAYHTPVILLSATLPAKRRRALVHAYLQLKESDPQFEENQAYPLLTWTEGQTIRQTALEYTKPSKNITVQRCCADGVQSIIADAVTAGGCVGVIMNTVRRAQQMAEAVRSNITSDVLLYHAQYIMPDRAKKENLLLHRVGKDSTSEERSGFVVVGTQVLEQSLDIDFDLLITDICPMDLLLQRMGRLHRHDRSERPTECSMPRCCVLIDECEAERSASKAIYSAWLLDTTLSHLPQTVAMPQDISPLVQTVYSAADESNAYCQYIQKQEQKIDKAKAFLLQSPRATDIHGLLIKEDCGNGAEASVRDGIASVEVIAMQKCADGSVRFLDGTPLSEELTDAQCRKIAEQKLKLPSRFCQVWNIDKTIREIEENCRRDIRAWQRSHWLTGQLVLFFDENMEAQLAGNRLQYSFADGLCYETECDEND